MRFRDIATEDIFPDFQDERQTEPEPEQDNNVLHKQECERERKIKGSFNRKTAPRSAKNVVTTLGDVENDNGEGPNCSQRQERR
ncbi:MAG: hypothetical protein AB7F72_14750 [Afipia sp.]